MIDRGRTASIGRVRGRNRGLARVHGRGLGLASGLAPGLAPGLAVGLALGLFLTGCQQESGPDPVPTPTPTPPTSSAPEPSEDSASSTLALNGLAASGTVAAALSTLELLPQSGRVVTRYDRDDYGERWEDVDGNGCNQRDDVLLRDAIPGTATVAPQGECDHDVLAGSWDDPYTGLVLTFDDLKDTDQAQALQIDHLVPLSEAHQSGADRWDAQRRLEFANDQDNLLAVDGPANNRKGDSDPAEWMPPYEPSHCAYAVIWVEVKDTWSLGVDAAERAALKSLLRSC